MTQAARRAAGRWTAWLIGIAAAAGAPGAAAQQAPQVRCGTPQPPFEANADNQLKGDVLQQRLSGKTLVFTRPTVGPAGRPFGQARFRIELRTDGSTQMTCKMRRNAGGGWQACQSVGTDGARDRDVGTWRIDGDQIVFQRTRFGEQESRITLHAVGARLAARRIATAPCLPGPATLE